MLHIDRVTSTLDARGGPVEVALRVDNPGAETAELQATVLLRRRPARRSSRRASPRCRPIPAEGQVSAVMTYELQGVTSIDDAGVQVGAPPSHVAFVPAHGRGGTAVTLEPQPLAADGHGHGRRPADHA